MAAIVLAAGKGTRMRSAHAKALHPLCGRPLASYAVRRALEAGADPVVVVVGHQAAAVEHALRSALPDAPLLFALQKEQLGTAHAVLAAKRTLRGFVGPILILTGDTPLLTVGALRTVIAARERARAALAFGTMTLENPAGYGRVVHGPHGRPVLVIEDKDATEKERAIREVNAFLYCVDSEFMWKTLDKLDSKNAQGEFYLTDLVALAAEGPGAVSAHLSPVEAAGVNDREELAAAARALVRRKASVLMRSGVTIEDPERFDCEEDVEVGADTIIEPGVRLSGQTQIGKRCRIGQGSVLSDATIASGVTVRPYTLVERATVGRNAIVGPFARLRPETMVGDEARVGNFVELKKTRLGRGSKASHLTYLGDAEIGAGVNVGAGTITCNYDGVVKHPTRIADGVFVGSDSILVAPISIGKGAYVAAGSTLTEDVPPGALALGRARQVVKPGWAAKRRAARTKAARHSKRRV